MGIQFLLGGLLMSFALSACGGGETLSGAPVVPLTASVSTSTGTVNTTTTATVTSDSGCTQHYDNPNVIETSGPDPLSANLWHLKNTGQHNGLPGEDLNIEAAWTLSLGSKVTIALVDDAVETRHPDLVKNINPQDGLDYRQRTSASAPPATGPGLPCNASDNHGTAVAGIIAAGYKNGIGTVGVAPNAKIVGYSALETRFDDAIVDALTRDLQRNDIFNNSWGSPDTGELWAADDFYAQAISTGISHGRAGRGAIYVFPSGNGGCALIDASGRCQTELATYDAYLNEMGLIVVSAIDHFGKRPSYSEPGANVLVSAPGGNASVGITTTSLGAKYTSSFAGTSAAAPMVSGVSALMLSANPNLTWRDVRLILARSARQNDPTHAHWQRAPKGGLWFNPYYGFGAVDAHAAVKLAQTWQTLGGSESLRRCEVTAHSSNAIPDDGTVALTLLNFDPSCAITAIEHVELVIDVAHEYSGDLDIRLVSPSQTQSQFAQSRICDSRTRANDDCSNFENWRIASVRHLDESPQGIWRLEIRDELPGKTGTLNAARLVIYGR
jgi:proprotein convertase subtilisin/kexin type 2